MGREVTAARPATEGLSRRDLPRACDCRTVGQAGRIWAGERRDASVIAAVQHPTWPCHLSISSVDPVTIPNRSRPVAQRHSTIAPYMSCDLLTSAVVVRVHARHIRSYPVCFTRQPVCVIQSNPSDQSRAGSQNTQHKATAWDRQGSRSNPTAAREGTRCTPLSLHISWGETDRREEFVMHMGT